MIEFDKIIKQKLDEAHYETDMSVWNSVQNALPNASASSSSAPSFFAGIAATVMMVAVMSGMNHKSTTLNESVIVPSEVIANSESITNAEVSTSNEDYRSPIVQQEAHEIEFVSTERAIEATDSKDVNSTSASVESVDLGDAKQSPTQLVVETNVAPLEIDFTAKGIQCPSSNIDFQATTKGLTGISWLFDGVHVVDGNDASFQFETAGQHDVIMFANDPSGARISVKKSIQIYEQPSANVAVELVENNRCFEQGVMLLADPGSNNYTWTIEGKNLEGTEVETNLIAGSYSASLTTVNVEGCASKSAHQFEVVGGLELFIPKAFTPDNDGTNDSWFPTGLDKCSQFTLDIFALNGTQKVYTTSSDSPWDGRIEGAENASQGQQFVYVLNVTDECGRAVQKRGTITVL